MNAQRLRTRLVVVIGPIAAGKTTVCNLLTDRLLAEGFTVAGADVDDVSTMIQAPGGRTQEHWDHAHLAHGSLVRGWLDSPVDLVIAHGPIYTRHETDSLMTSVPSGTAVLRILLLASINSALQRVQGEPDRGLSKDPTFLRATYERFWSIRPTMDRCDLTFDTESESPEHIAKRIADRLLDVPAV